MTWTSVGGGGGGASSFPHADTMTSRAPRTQRRELRVITRTSLSGEHVTGAHDCAGNPGILLLFSRPPRQTGKTNRAGHSPRSRRPDARRTPEPSMECVQKQAPRLQVAAVAGVDRVAQQVLQPPRCGRKLAEWQADKTLALVRAEIHGHEPPVTVGARPRGTRRSVLGAVALPRGDASRSRQSPCNAAPPHGEHPVVERRVRASTGSSGPRTRWGEIRVRRPSNCPWWKKRSPGDRNVSAAAARCTSGGNVAAARGSSWFSRNRASLSW